MDACNLHTKNQEAKDSKFKQNNQLFEYRNLIELVGAQSYGSEAALRSEEEK
jgi:hypothetical protein